MPFSHLIKVRAKDADAGRWGRLCYALAGDGVLSQQSKDHHQNCLSSSRNKEVTLINPRNPNPEHKSQLSHKISEDILSSIIPSHELDDPVSITVKNMDDKTSNTAQIPAFSIDSTTGVISVMKVD